MNNKIVCAKSDPKDLLGMSDATAKAIFANCTTHIALPSAKTGAESETLLKNFNVQTQFAPDKKPE